jgi:hypothetical protein
MRSAGVETYVAKSASAEVLLAAVLGQVKGSGVNGT